MNASDSIIQEAIRGAIVNNIMNIYRDTIRNVRNPNRNILVPTLRMNNLISSRYYNNPPQGGYQINEEHEYIFPDHDDISAMVFLDVATRFGSPGSDCEIKDLRKNKIKQIGKYKKVKSTDTELIESTCPICLETFQLGEFHRTLECTHSFHKKCIDKWFKKDHCDCPMCRKIIIT
jgi:hypothetical protein